ncbi:imidazole glycerol phosphate synthase cyclase subunit [Paracoccaceae bacterium]|nr:imidazole glycerol phosphate synthase cyclase subunit [Paracoccaceae bacterium]
MDSNIRIIPRLDIKGENLIKSVQLEGLRVVGKPEDFAKKYYESGADELIFMDTVASLYGRNQLFSLIKKSSKNIFIPITVGGGIRSVDNVKEILRSGADKVAVNTAAVLDPNLLRDISKSFGSQCLVLSVEAKRYQTNSWKVLIENGRERTDKDVFEWIRTAVQLGVGEILLTSVDKEGTRKGFDIELVRKVAEYVDVPVIASGGMGTSLHVAEAIDAGATAVAIADAFHYNRVELSELKQSSYLSSFNIRRP